MLSLGSAPLCRSRTCHSCQFLTDGAETDRARTDHARARLARAYRCQIFALGRVRCYGCPCHGPTLHPQRRSQAVTLPTCAGYRPVTYLRPAWVADHTRCGASSRSCHTLAGPGGPDLRSHPLPTGEASPRFRAKHLRAAAACFDWECANPVGWALPSTVPRRLTWQDIRFWSGQLRFKSSRGSIVTITGKA